MAGMAAIRLPGSLIAACRAYVREIKRIEREFERYYPKLPAGSLTVIERDRRRLHDRVIAELRKIGARSLERADATLLAYAIVDGQYTGQEDPKEWLKREGWLVDAPQHSKAALLEDIIVDEVARSLKALGIRVVSVKARGQLFRELQALRGRMARAAQRVYDRWQPGDYGGGGACDDIAGALLDVALDARSADGGRVAGWAADHAFALVWSDELGEACRVDISPYTYETGGGYNWDKIEGVRFSSGDVYVEDISEDIEHIKGGH